MTTYSAEKNNPPCQILENHNPLKAPFVFSGFSYFARLRTPKYNDCSRKYMAGFNDKSRVKIVKINASKSGTIKSASGRMALEYQRYGRNKETLVNKSYINGGKYRRKFDVLTNNDDVNKALYDSAKTALKHRSGTLLERYVLD